MVGRVCSNSIDNFNYQRLYGKSTHSYLGYLLLLSAIVSILNIISIGSVRMSICIIAVEVLSLVFLIVIGKYTLFYSLFVVFSSLSIEISTFAGLEEHKSLTTVRFLGINVVAWILVFFIIYSFIIKKKRNFKINKEFSRLFFAFLFIILLGVVIGLFNILINDNEIRSIDFLKHYIAIFYIMGFCPLLFIISTFVCLSSEPSKSLVLKNAIIAVIFGSCVQGIFSYLNHYTISLGGLDDVGIAASNIYFYLPFGITLFFCEPVRNMKFKYPLLVVFVAGVAVFLINNANGKFIISLFISLIISIMLMNYKERLIVLPLLICFAFAAIIYASQKTDIFSQYLLKQKIEEVRGLLNVFSPSWLSNMPASPRFRITEFMNTVVEYEKKPWYLLFGKGYAGSIRDHLHAFVKVGGEYSDDQWEIGSFFYLHESFNLLFLNNGILGVLLWVNILVIFMKNYKKSFFIILGCAIFLITYGYSFVLTLVGFTSLVVGAFDCCHKKQVTLGGI